MVTAPPAPFREFAHATIDAGFDLVHGHSAHVFQGIEIYRGRPIFYDTGDFIDDYRVDAKLRNDWSFIFLADVAQPPRVERVRLIPTRLTYARVDLATGDEAKAICARMIERCAALGTPAVQTGEHLTVECEVHKTAAVSLP
jgi:poly-gamma-glutamate synthesis protein (capsule biosynthesis protein)